MSCCGSGPSNFYPKPDDRSGDGAGMRAVNADAIRRQRAADNSRGGGGDSSGGSGGYRRFYSARLSNVSNRVADIVAEPSSVRLRDVAMAVLAVYALYTGAFSLFQLYTLFAKLPVGRICAPHLAALGCSYVYLWATLYPVAEWAGGVLMWSMVGAVAVFFCEEIARAIPTRATTT